MDLPFGSLAAAQTPKACHGMWCLGFEVGAFTKYTLLIFLGGLGLGINPFRKRLRQHAQMKHRKPGTFLFLHTKPRIPTCKINMPGIFNR